MVIGARNEEQLKDNLGAVGWNLTPEQVAKLDKASAPPAGLSLLAPGPVRRTQSVSGLTMLPAIFVSHGAPTLPFDDVPARDFLRGLGQQLGRPRAIVAVSAHWDTDAPAVNAVAGQRHHP